MLPGGLRSRMCSGPSSSASASRCSRRSSSHAKEAGREGSRAAAAAAAGRAVPAPRERALPPPPLPPPELHYFSRALPFDAQQLPASAVLGCRRGNPPDLPPVLAKDARPKKLDHI